MVCTGSLRSLIKDIRSFGLHVNTQLYLHDLIAYKSRLLLMMFKNPNASARVLTSSLDQEDWPASFAAQTCT